MEGERNEGDQAAGLILQFAELDQVIDAVLFILDVTVEHGAVRMKTELMGDAGGVEPLLAGQLVVANDAATPVVEDFGAAAGEGVHASVLQPLQRFADRNFGALGQIADFDHRESLEVHLREALLQAAQHLAVPVECELGVESADDVEFGARSPPADSGSFPNLFERHGVGLGIFGALAERAQTTTGDTYVGGIDVAVDVEVSGGSVQALANDVGHVTEREDVGAAVHGEAIVIAETDAGLHLFQNRLQPAVFKNGLHRKYPRPKTKRIARSHSRSW